jgi:hypothetical protein
MTDRSQMTAEAEIKKLRGIIVNLTNAAAEVIGANRGADHIWRLDSEVKAALRDAGIKEGDYL